MIYFSEAVFNGHPDKFCDILADGLLAKAYQLDRECYGQIEVSVWSDAVWFSGAIATRSLLELNLNDFVKNVGYEIGLGKGNPVDAARYRIINEVCFLQEDPTQWTHKVNDQCIAIGWAGYDKKTHYLPPEHYLAHMLRTGLINEFNGGHLSGYGPDGKILVRLREEDGRWIVEHVLVSVQQSEDSSLLDVATAINEELSRTYILIRKRDSRWQRKWNEIEVLVNPNGPLLSSGSDGDNGQTGRKLVMDYYGPRVPIGGGALSGKDLSHIDRVSSYATRQAAITAVMSGAKSCQVTLSYAPNRNKPLDIHFDMKGHGMRLPDDFFNHDQMRKRYSTFRNIERLGYGIHFFDLAFPWNQTWHG